MGLDSYSPISTANSTTSKAECTQGYNAAYSYYTSDATRVKYQMNANGTLTTSTGFYWERSLHYTDTNYACKIWVGGSDSYSIYSDDNYLAPAFVIGNSDAPSPSGKITQDGEDITNKIASILGGTKVEVGSYIGTGTYGASNPNKLTFSFEPKVVFFWERLPSASSSNIL